MSRYAITALHSEQVGRRFRKGAGETHPLSEFLVVLWPAWYPEGVENTSTESIIFKCVSDAAPQSKDRTAETEACPAALYQRPSSGSCHARSLRRSRRAEAPQFSRCKTRESRPGCMQWPCPGSVSNDFRLA